MNQKHRYKPHCLPNASDEDTRERAEDMLRDIAFVLSMTRKVRAEMEAEQETEELVLA